MITNERLIEILLSALTELADLMQDVIDGNYTPDSFALQPARAAIAEAKEQKYRVECDK